MRPSFLLRMARKGRTPRPREVDAAIRAVANSQHWVVAAWQLLQREIGREAIRARDGSLLFRVHAGVYAVGRPTLDRRGRLMAATLALGPGALLSHASAAELWGVARPRGGAVDVTGPAKALPKRAGITYHYSRCLRPEDRCELSRIPVTSVARTLLDIATDGRRLRRALDEADRLGILQVGELEALLRRTRGHRGRGRLARLTAAHTTAPPTRSELEDRFLDLCREADLPMPEANARVAGIEVDMYWPRHRLVVELDGAAFHRTAAAQERDRAREAIVYSAGLALRRFGWRQVVERSSEVGRLVGAALGRDA